MKIIKQSLSGIGRHGQIKMAETIGVMFVFFMLLVLVMVFYSRIQAGSVVAQNEEQFIQKSIDISQIVAYLPEVQCSRDNVLEDNCFDLYKIESLKNVNQNEQSRLYYFDQFEYSQITIQRVYPTGEDIIIYDNPKPGWKGKSLIPVPIIVYDPIARLYGFGVLNVATYK